MTAAVKMIGVENVGIGSDVSLEGYDDLLDVTEGLIRRKYSDDQILMILGGNCERVLRQIWI